MIKMDKKEQILHYYRVDGLSLREITERRETLDGKSGVSFFCLSNVPLFADFGLLLLSECA